MVRYKGANENHQGLYCLVSNCTTSWSRPLRHRAVEGQKRVEIKGLPGIPSCPGAPQSAGAAAVALLLLAPVGVSSARRGRHVLRAAAHLPLCCCCCCCCCRPRALPLARTGRSPPREEDGRVGGRQGEGAGGQMCSDKFQLLAGRRCAHTCASAFFFTFFA